MATHKLGKLKINRSEDGIAFRFGEGKIFRLGLGKKKGEAPEYDEERYLDEDGYAQDGFEPEGYSGRFHSSSRGSYEYDEEYADDYADEEFYEDDYADEEPYDDGYGDGYEDEYADGEYQDGYADGYYDEEGEYDDRYSDEDAGDYMDGGYAEESPIWRYVDENAWVTYLLLVILPPLGIYLLWRYRRFERPVRWILSGVSAVWFIVILILIFSAIFSGSSERTKNPSLEITTPTPTIAAAATATPSPDGEGSGGTGLGADPSATQDALAPDVSATPIAGFNANTGVGTISGADTVVMTATGTYYHNNALCANIEADASRSNVTKEVAEARGKAPCPLCYPNQKTYYATSGGKYYHVDQTCSNMENASVITKEAAVEQGKLECPACIEGKVQSLANGALRFATASTTDRSGITVYATENGKYFHNSSTCSGMKGAVSGSLLKAMLAGKTACPTCCASAGTMVFCTQGGTYYHNNSNCSGMENAFQVTLGEALVLGKKRCSECLTGTVSVGAAGDEADESGIYVYGTKNGTYYHTNANCSGMDNASRYTLKSMLVAGRPACPECCSGADTTVYATEKGTYYHSFATCSGMKNANAGTMAEALAYGKEKCPECWTTGGSVAELPSEENKSGTKVYATATGKYYHTRKSCNGMSGASQITLETALEYGKTACPDCASTASKTVYSMKYGKYYHKESSCENQDGMTKRTLEEALVKGQTACPVCMGGKTQAEIAAETEKENMEKLESSNTYRSGTSGVKVYATSTSQHFHTKEDCQGMVNASRITLETALNYGKTPCSKCASEARDTVYAVKGGKYYHLSKSCAGDGATSGSRAEALAYGFDACPNCVTKTQTVESSDTYKSGTSGVNVYASVNGKYYHKDKTCAGDSASRITLETALNYAKKPCPSCASAAGKTVYSSGSDKYYHTSRDCAGSGASSGDFAKALALGKEECPICIGGSESYEISDVKYSAPAETSVYVDLDNEMLYYHKAARCSDAGLHGGTKQTLEFVLDLNYKPCPFCAPPTSIG
ncbi:MAG: hypothetical protein IJ466_07515 [Clostridia bacterium]|nr:hypothetical protein [Clostridia bacterium]